MLPDSRNTDYAGGMPVLSFDLNDLQDNIVRLSRLETWTLDLTKRLVISGTWTVGTSGSPNGNGKLTEASTGQSCGIWLILPVGGLLHGYSIRCQEGSTTSLLNAKIQRWGDGIVGYSSGTKFTNGTGTVQTLADSNLAHTITQARYELNFGTSGAGASTRTVWHASISFYMPRT
jgi:hypothetical protein